MVHVALNALSNTNRSGTGRYTWGLIHGFVQGDFPKLTLSVMIPSNFSIPSYWRKRDGLRFYSIPANNPISRIVWEQFSLPRLLHDIKPDILHSPAFIAPFLRKSNVFHLVTIHDLAYQRFPQTIPTIRLMYYRWAIRRSMKIAAMILTDSDAIKKELCAVLPSNQPIVPIHLGIDTERYHPEENFYDEVILGSYGIIEPYFLFVGTLEPRKNLPALITAFQQVREQGLNEEFVIVGRMGWLQNEKLFRSPGVRWIDFVPEDHLPTLYRRARAFLAPSIYEGFDLPPLEALACGTPVIASDIPIHREVLGDAAAFVEIDNINDWATALLRVSNTPKPVLSYTIRDWIQVAEETYQVYTKIVPTR